MLLRCGELLRGKLGCTIQGLPGLQSSAQAALERGGGSRAGSGRRWEGEARRPGLAASSSSSPSPLQPSGCCSARQGTSAWQRGPCLAFLLGERGNLDIHPATGRRSQNLLSHGNLLQTGLTQSSVS